MKMITITTTAGGGTSKQSRPLSQATDTTITLDGIDLARVKISASGRVARVDVAGQTVYGEASTVSARAWQEKTIAWLLAHEDDEAFRGEVTCNCGDFNETTDAVTIDKLIAALQREVTR